MSSPVPSPFEPFLTAAAEAADARPNVDAEMIREIFIEAAIMLHNGLALDGLDAHDTDVVVSGLCVALVDDDPGAAVREQAKAAVTTPDDLHDPDGVAAAYLMAASVLQI